MDYEKKYKEALERAKGLRDSFSQTMNAKRVVEEIFPQLAESEDERMIRILKEGLEGLTVFNYTPVDKILDWLEKQKESLHISEMCKENGESFTSKQKEQDECPEYCVRSHCIGCPIYEKQKEQKPVEWSKEDEKIRQSLINDLENAETDDADVQKELNEKIAWLKSLRRK